MFFLLLKFIDKVEKANNIQFFLFTNAPYKHLATEDDNNSNCEKYKAENLFVCFNYQRQFCQLLNNRVA